MMIKGTNSAAFNILSVVMLGLTALACLCCTTLFFVPALAGPFAGPPKIQASLPTSTPTVGSLLPATWTATPTNTPQDTPTPFYTTTPEPTNTPVNIGPLLTRTKVPTRTPTPRFTPSRYKFTAVVTYQPAPIYNPCGASLIAGTITDLEDKPVTASNMIIHVDGDADIDANLHPGEQVRGNKVEGASPLAAMSYGPSAWSVIINLSGTAAGTWRAWLIQNGRQVSDRIEVRLQSDCSNSSAVVRFQQNH